MGGLRSLKPFVKIYTILVTVFFVSMILVYCIPTLWIQKNVEASLEVMEGKGNDRPMRSTGIRLLWTTIQIC